MSDFAIRLHNVGKRYRIQQRAHYLTIRETLTDAIRTSLRFLRTNGSQPSSTSDSQITDRNLQSDNYFWALKDVCFEIKRGEVVGIIGRNGAGKSTLLKILSRITRPTEGYAEVYGRVGSLLEVGTGFHPELTGRENIYLNGAILGMKKTELNCKFDEIVAFAEVEKFIDTPVKHYSSGMYMRLAFAVAAHLEPEILLVDEVLAVGDAAFQKKCLGKIGSVAREGRAVLFVSHNLGAVSSLCSKTIYLADGQIRASGPTEQIVTDYLSEVFQNRIEDLEQLRLAGYGKEVRFCDIRLLSNDGSNLLFGEPIKCALTLKSDIDVKDLCIATGIFNSSGTCVGTSFTKEKISLKADQQLTLRLTISNLNLAPGSYYTAFSIGRGRQDGTRHDLDIVIGKPAFQVLPISENGEPIASWSSGWGNIVLRDTQLTIDKG